MEQKAGTFDNLTQDGAGDFSGLSTRLTLPPIIYTVVGKEINIYFDNLIWDDYKKYNIDVSCDIGLQQDERWTCIPDTAGSYPIVIDFYDDALNLAGSAASDILVAEASANDGQHRKLLFLGDSLIAIGVYTGELLALFNQDGMGISLLGTKGKAPNLHEGYGGKSVKWHFTNAESPFVFDGKFDFGQYMTEHGFKEIDWVFIHLGANDVFEKTSDSQVDEVISNNYKQLEAMMANMKAFCPEVGIALLLPIPPSRHQDSFGANYGCGQTRWRYKRNIHRYASGLIHLFYHRRKENIFLVPENVNIDTERNMKTENVPANSRSQVVVTRQSNGVHPADGGYRQMADSVYYFLKNMSVKDRPQDGGTA